MSVFDSQVDGLLVGFPCKSISGQNTRPAAFTNASSTTGGGFDSLMKFVDRNIDSLQWVVAENVKDLSNNRKQFDECPIQVQTTAFQKRNFVGWSRVLQSCMFGLPQSRPRTWAVYIRKDLIRRGCLGLIS